MKTTKMEINVADYRMSQQCNAVVRMIRLSYILTDTTDIVLPVSKEVARCLKYSVQVWSSFLKKKK